MLPKIVFRPWRSSRALTDTDRDAFEARIIADPSSAAPYLVYADWLQRMNDPQGELIVLDHALSGVGQLIGSRRDGLGRELYGAQVDDHQRELIEREAELLKQHNEYLLEGVEPSETLQHMAWRLGFIESVMIDNGEPKRARRVIETLAVAPSARFLQTIQFTDQKQRANYEDLGVLRFECLRSVTRSDPDFSIPSPRAWGVDLRPDSAPLRRPHSWRAPTRSQRHRT